MKKNLLFVFLLSTAAMTSCVSNLYPDMDERLTNLTLQPHNLDVEVLFAEEWPKEEHIKIAAIESRGREDASYIELIRDLKNRAQKYGADAVVVQGKTTFADVYSDVYRRVNTVGSASLTGIAIKYKRNLDLGVIRKYQQVEIYDPAINDFRPILDLQLNIQGFITGQKEWQENAMGVYNAFIQNYSLSYLNRSGTGWTQLQQAGYVVERRLHQRGSLVTQINFNYSKERQLQQIVITAPPRQSEEITYTYDLLGRLVTRHVKRGGSPYIIEEYAYDENDKVREVQIYNAVSGKIPLLRSTYSYHTNE